MTAYMFTEEVASMLVCNLFGGPHQGKSTTRAGVFYRLKCASIKVDEVFEVAKPFVLEGNLAPLEDPLIVIAGQNRQLRSLRGSVDVVVTDSPILQVLAYQPPGYPVSFAPLVRDIAGGYENLNYLVSLSSDSYCASGRYQDADGAARKHRQICRMLESERVTHKAFDAAHAVDMIVADVLSELEIRRGLTEVAHGP